VSHSPSRWCCQSSDKCCDRFLAVVLDPLCRFFFGRAADLADQDHRIRVSIFVEKFNRVEMRDAVNWIAADSDTS
jgi:hypothetical protein